MHSYIRDEIEGNDNIVEKKLKKSIINTQTHKLKTIGVSPVGSRPYSMELHHQSKSTQFGKISISFEPII